MDADRAVDALAATQFGLVARSAARSSGLSDAQLATRRRSGRWLPVHAGVYVAASTPTSWEQRVCAALLAAGPHAAASHRSAAIAWHIANLGGSIVEITVPYGNRSCAAGVVAHRSRDLSDRWTTSEVGYRVTTPARTLLDLGAVVRPRVVERAVTSALGQRLTTLAELHGTLEALGRRGRRGAGTLRAVLERWREDPSGIAEAELTAVLIDADVPEPVPEFEVRHDGRFVARVDLALPDARLAIEVNGYEWHATYDRFAADHVRRNALRAAGWQLVEFTPTQVRRDPEGVRRTVEVAYRSSHSVNRIAAHGRNSVHRTAGARGRG